MFQIGEDFKIRLIYGVVLFTSAVILIALGGFFYTFAIMLLAVICTAEMFMIVGANTPSEELKKNIILKGVFAIFIPAFSMYLIREGFSKGMITSFWFFILVASVDTFAFISGRLFGKNKIAPSVSPSKTWEGLIGGVLLATLFSVGFYYFFSSGLNIIVFIIFSFMIAIFAQVSDFCESYFKRQFKVKDSSQLIPGHGGFLDRLDGYFLTAPMVVLCYFLAKLFFGIGIF